MNELQVIISKTQKQKVHVQEGWYSESEMKTELKWSQSIA